MQHDLAEVLASPPLRLPYSVHSSSGYHTSFPPTKIYQDCPHDDTSRWTAPTPEERKKERKAAAAAAAAPSPARSGSRRDSEWILLELEPPCLVRSVGFGKTTKPHPCNLAEFSILGGLSADPLSMEPLVEGSLKNDAATERVQLPVELGNPGREPALLPIRYLRIECHEAASPNYSISIWHLFLEGHPLPPPLLHAAIESYTTHRDQVTAHLILAHLRRTGPSTLAAFEAYLSTLAPSVAAAFEHPVVSQLHETLVVMGDFARAEHVLHEALDEDLFREWAPPLATYTSRVDRHLERKGKTTARWERLDTALSSNRAAGGAAAGGGGTRGPRRQPGPRGGHQMVRIGRKLVLFGGWDGTRDLGDLWEWDLPRVGTVAEGREAGLYDGGAAAGGGGGGGGGEWRLVETGEENDGKPRPGKRSCHQLAVDDHEGWIYLLGKRVDPWDEDEADDDEDAASAGENRMEVERDGPARVGDPERNGAGQDATRGDGARTNGARHEDRYRSDFWRYKAVGPGRGTWELLSEDTRADGGPDLLFDHAMVLHSATQRLFVFGGKRQGVQDGAEADERPRPLGSTPPPRVSSQYSGMYCYDIAQRKWALVFGDPSVSTPPSFLSDRLLPRAGHSMVLDTSARTPTIYIYGGQRDTRYEGDLWAIRLASPRTPSEEEYEDEGFTDPDISIDPEDLLAEEDERLWRQGAVLGMPPLGAETTPFVGACTPPRSTAFPGRQTIVQIRRVWPPGNGPAPPATPAPPASFTPRLSITATRSITLLTGLTRSGSGSSMVETTLEGIWRKGTTDLSAWEKIEEWAGGYQDESRKPPGRFASQVVYDPFRDEHYVFGGHPHSGVDPDTRLADFWKLQIVDPTPEEALRMATFHLRKQRFNEMCTTVPTVLALQYLQNDLSSVVDHSSPAESSAFRTCMTALLSAPPQHNIDVSLEGSGELPTLDGSASVRPDSEGERYAARHKLFEELLEFFPRSERQPVEELSQVGRLLRSARR
ncbi:hypothetical protein JCM10212_005497 [Sporobolomyces blumeae]